MKLRAKSANGTTYRLSGQQILDHQWPACDTLSSMPRTDPDCRIKRITAFLIEKDMKGFSTGSISTKLGMRGSNTAELSLHDVGEGPVFEKRSGQ